MLISFVIPCYRSENTLPQVVETIQNTVAEREGFEAELVLVNDASPDNTWGVNIAKNSGQQSAIMAGLRHSTGELVAVSDDDGQTPIETVFDFYDCMQQGNYDVVCADYQDRGKRSLFRNSLKHRQKMLTRMISILIV